VLAQQFFPIVASKEAEIGYQEFAVVTLLEKIQKVRNGFSIQNFFSQKFLRFKLFSPGFSRAHYFLSRKFLAAEFFLAGIFYDNFF